MVQTPNKPMDKSLGNYIGITEDPWQMLGKVMSICDETMKVYYRLLTDVDWKEVKKMHPKQAKLNLAEMIVSDYYSSVVAKKERKEFERVFSKRELPQDVPVYESSQDMIDLVETFSSLSVGVVSTRNEARRLIEQKGVKEVETGKVIQDRMVNIPSQGLILKIGKRKFLKIVRKED